MPQQVSERAAHPLSRTFSGREQHGSIPSNVLLVVRCARVCKLDLLEAGGSDHLRKGRAIRDEAQYLSGRCDGVPTLFDEDRDAPLGFVQLRRAAVSVKFDGKSATTTK